MSVAAWRNIKIPSMSIGDKMHRNAAVVLTSVITLSASDFNQKLLKLFLNLFSVRFNPLKRYFIF